MAKTKNSKRTKKSEKTQYESGTMLACLVDYCVDSPCRWANWWANLCSYSHEDR